MKKIIVYVLLVLTLCLSFSFVTNVIAKDNVVLNVSEKEVELGEEIIVSVNVNSEHANLYAYTASLSYDKDVFENIESEDFTEQENWSDISYNKENNKFALINKKGVNSDKLVEIKLKVRDDAKIGYTTISINNVTASDGEEDISISASSQDILVGKSEIVEGENIPNTNTEAPTETDTQLEVKRKIPVMGIILIIIMLCVLVSLIIYYCKFAKKDEGTKKFIVTLIHMVVLLVLLLFTIKAFNTKNLDVNKDNKIDYNDSKDIIKYILEIEKPHDEEEVEDRDLNNDGRVTITDAARATQEATNQGNQANSSGGTTNPSDSQNPTEPNSPQNPTNPNDSQNPTEPNNPQNPAEPSNPQDPNEPNNPQDPTEPNNPQEPITASITDLQVLSIDRDVTKSVKLQFKATNSSIYDIASVKIDGFDHEVQKVEGTTDTYIFEYPFYDNVDVRKELRITELTLTNDAEVELDDKPLTIIFKHKPIIQNVSLKVNDNNTINVTFESEDKDDIFEEISVVLRNEQGETITTQSLGPDDTQTEFSVIHAGKYNVKFHGTYNSVDGLTHTDEHLIDGGEVEILPKVKVSTVSVSNPYPEKGETVELKYNIESNTKLVPTKIVLNNNEEYSLIPDENEAGLYKISYVAPSESVLLNLQVTKVYFGDENSIDTPENTPFDIIEVLKDIPLFNITSTDVPEQGIVLFDINIEDPDDAFVSAKGIFQDEEKTLEKGSNSWAVSVTPNEEHNIEFEIEYDRDYDARTSETGEDANTDKVKENKTFKLVSDYEFKITELEVCKEDGKQSNYFNKNEKVQVKFNYDSKVPFELDTLVVDDINDEETDGLEYKVQTLDKDSKYKYYIELKSKGTFGKQELDITAAISNDTKLIPKDKFAHESPKATFEVLKTKPTMSNYTCGNHENTITVKFDVVDDDNALKDSHIKVLSKTTNQEKSELITKGENSHEFTDLVPGEKYVVIIENNYVLSEDESIKGNDIFSTQEITIAKEEDPDFEVRNLSITKRVPINGKVRITFENSIMTYHDVDTIMIDDKEYTVKKNDSNVYEVQLEPKDKGVNIIYLKSVKIKDKTFDINRNLSYTHEYIVPTATNVSEIQENTNTGEAEITYTLNDPDKSIRELTAYMKTSSGAIVATKKLELEEEKARLTMSLLKLNPYSIELKAMCDIGDGVTLEEKELFTKEKKSTPRVIIMEQSVDKEYVNKGENVTLTFKLNTNVDQEVKKIYIGDNSYNVKKVTIDGKIVEDTYTVTLEAPKESGVFEQKVTQVQIGTNLIKASYPDKTEYVKIKVYKDVPTLTHFIIDEKGGTIKFKINDSDNALVKPAPKFIVRKNDEDLYSGDLEIGKGDYELKLDTVNMNEKDNPYDITVNATYDLRPDAPQNANIFKKVAEIFNTYKEYISQIASDENPDEENPDEEEPEVQYVITTSIFNKQLSLTGDITYNLTFADVVDFYLFSLRQPLTFEFDCSTGTKYKVEKVIIDGKEYPVEEMNERDYGFDDKFMHRYKGEYIAEKFEQKGITYEQVILENGTALDIEDGFVPCMVQMTDPTFEITDFIENIQAKTVTFNFKLVDQDDKLAKPLTFTLKDSQENILETKKIKREENVNSIEFNMPNPPTSVYRLQVTSELYEVAGWDEWYRPWTAWDDVYDSSVNTSILNSKLSTKYPKKGEAFTIDYGISSTKVILIDKDDHSNQDKAVTIQSLVINGKDYEVQPLDTKEMYRIYYTAKDEAGIEDIKVTHVKFSNGDIEEFNKDDQVEVLKDVPQITNFKSENDVANSKINFSFDITDFDGVIGSNTLYACIGSDKVNLNREHNDISFNVEKDKLLKFEVKATYDLDDNKLQSEDGEDDNDYTENTIFEKQVMLTGDYNVNISNIKKVNSKGETTEFFEKGESIKLYFDCTTKQSELYPQSVTIDDKKYELEKVKDTENTYTITLPGVDNAGQIKAIIQSITLNSGNDVTLDNQTFTYEILKDVVKVTTFNHAISESNADTVNLEIEIEDLDNSNKELKIEIADEFGNEVTPSQSTLNVGENSLTFKKTLAEKYFVSIYSTYNRSINNQDKATYHEHEKIHNQIVSTTTRYIEMKDIVDIKLFTFDKYGHTAKVDSLTESNLDVLHNCLVEVTMKDIPAFYSRITSYRVENGKLKLVLAYDDAMVYTGEEELKPLEVTLDILQSDDGYGYSGSFKSLVDKMREKPDGEFVLDKDYDLSDYPTGEQNAIISDFDFKGKINGNGHKISNITKPIFQKLDGATIENLVIDRVVLNGGEGKGSLAITATNGTKITNVHVQNLTSPGNTTAAFVYELTNNSTLEKCSGTNLRFNTTFQTQNVAGAVVSLKNNSKIENCYVQGVITSGWWRNGGFIALSDKTSQITHNIVDMKMSAYFAFTDEQYGYGNGGIVSNAQNADSKDGLVRLDHNLSLVEGNHGVAAIYNFKGCSLTNDSEKNYQLDTAVVKNDEGKGVKTISRDKINKEFFTKELGLDTNIWNISDDASADKLPVLKGVSTSFNDSGKQPNNTKVYIPDYNRVSQLEGYRKDREITYNNMYKLMPFYDAKEIIRDGNKIPDGNELNTKLVKYIVPFNKEGKMVTYLTTENYNSLGKIYIVFEDGSKLTYNIDFDDYYGNVASYMITELNIGYNYNKYILDPNHDIINTLIETASTYEFKKDLAPLTEKIAEDSRLYQEHFDKYTKYHIKEFVINSLANMGYTPHFESDVLDDKIRQELVNNGMLKKLLFAYNYFTYWYNLDMDGINLADSVMFHSNEMFDKDMTFSYLASQLVQGTNSATNGTATFYNNYMVKYTRISNLGLFLDYYVNSLTHFAKGDDWFKANWHGGKYYTVNIDGAGASKVEYTLWDHLKRDSKVQTDFLPLMTVPENSTYVVSSPTQAYFGSLRVYMTDPTNPEQMAEFEKKVEPWLNDVKWFYTFAYTYWGADTMNRTCDVNYDMRYTLTGKGDETVYNKPLTTEEPYHKYFTEAVDRWAGTSGAAYANGIEVYWVVIKMFDSFRVGTHETLHNQDSKIFMNGYGRRGDAEDYAAGFLQQYYRDGWVSPNIFDETPSKENTTQNLRRSSVETNEKLQAFYDKYFRVNDFLDYIEAQAYFQLSPEQKANISVQVSYPEVEDQNAGDDVVAYTPLTTEEVQKMGDIKDMKDLWDNRIMLRPGVKEYEKRSPGADTDSIFNIHWYQPHADNGRPDGANFKYLAWQMAGERGYYDGLCAYYSASYIASKKGTKETTTDLTAIRYITNNDKMTFEKYKLERYEKLAKHYEDEGTYIDAKAIYKEYLEALKADADSKDRNLSKSTAVKKKYFRQIQNDTNDFNIEPFSQKTEKTSIDEKEVTNEIENNIVEMEENKVKENMTDGNKVEDNIVEGNVVEGNTVDDNIVEENKIQENTIENIINQTNETQGNLAKVNEVKENATIPQTEAPADPKKNNKNKQTKN